MSNNHDMDLRIGLTDMIDTRDIFFSENTCPSEIKITESGIFTLHTIYPRPGKKKERIWKRVELAAKHLFRCYPLIILKLEYGTKNCEEYFSLDPLPYKEFLEGRRLWAEKELCCDLASDMKKITSEYKDPGIQQGQRKNLKIQKNGAINELTYLSDSFPDPQLIELTRPLYYQVHTFLN